MVLGLPAKLLEEALPMLNAQPQAARGGTAQGGGGNQPIRRARSIARAAAGRTQQDFFGDIPKKDAALNPGIPCERIPCTL